MAEKTTSRWAIPYPTETGNVKVGAQDLEEIAKRLDEILYPPGELRFTGKAALDAGWLRCEGQAVSRTTFKALFEAIGTAFGAGDKSTTFNVPNFIERVPMGPGSLAVGSTTGAKEVTLSTSQMPFHSHTDVGHFHVAVSGDAFLLTKGFGPPNYVRNLSITMPPGGSASWENVGLGAIEDDLTTGEGHAALTSAGNGFPHNNVQPSTVCNMWIKT